MLARLFKPPVPIELYPGERSVFLAGSIDQGTATDWQSALVRSLADLPVAILNPRRDAWDASWVQSITNPQFREQVEWELDGLARVDIIAMYFAPSSQAPITLLELGLFAASRKIIVCCPNGYWRRGNVEIIAQRHQLEWAEDLSELNQKIRLRLAKL